MKTARVFCILLAQGLSASLAFAQAELVEVRRIWDQAPHNAFTDLARFRGRWYCAFREGAKHASPDGALRVLISSGGVSWTSAALLTSTTADLRDPKLTVAPGNRLMLTAVAAVHPPANKKHQTLAWFSADGRKWDGPHEIGEPDMWLWRAAWREGRAYGVGYHTAGDRFVRLYSSRDGRNFIPLVDRLFEADYPNEAALVFLDNDVALCLLRRDSGAATAQLGTASPPYRDWSWRDLGVRVGGPGLIRLPDGSLIAAVRLYDNRQRTSLCRLDPQAARLTEILALPSGGDTSYAGLVFHDNLLWISYYSSHEGKSAIYLAKVKI